MVTTRDEYRTALKEGKKYLKSGNHSRAENWLGYASEFARHMKDKHREALVWHRLAEVAVFQNEPMRARHRFKLALELVDKENHVAYAIVLRDYGEFERRTGHRKIARRHVEHAVSLLDTAELLGRKQRLELERTTTRGFVARLGLGTKAEAASIITLKEVASELWGCRKPQYELANLAILIEVLPIWDLDRARYIIRAITLSIQLRNRARFTEFLVLLGGKPLRGIYRVTLK